MNRENTMKTTIIVAALLAAFSAHAERPVPGALPEDKAAVVITGGRIATPVEAQQPGAIYLIGADGKLRAAIVSDGTLEFSEGATVDFPELVTNRGPIAGYVVVRVAGERYLMPVYRMGKP